MRDIIHTQLRMPRTMAEMLKKSAEKNNRSQNSEACFAIARHLGIQLGEDPRRKTELIKALRDMIKELGD